MDWDPELYLKFANERTQPAIDLVARIGLAAPGSIIDVGCGPGNSTQLLARRWPDAQITGLDSSEKMIARAREDFPQLNWVVADATKFAAGRQWDLVFSSAALQWMGDHEALLPRLFGWVNPAGALAVQLPVNKDSPLHQSVLAVAEEVRWRSRTAACAGLLTYAAATFYYDLLAREAVRLDSWETTYYHVLSSHQGLIEWYRGTGMRPFLERLQTDADRREFEAEVMEKCRGDYPVRQDGKVLYPFKRLFFIAYRR